MVLLYECVYPYLNGIRETDLNASPTILPRRPIIAFQLSKLAQVMSRSSFFLVPKVSHIK